jgi:hypothetical protein
MQLRDCCIPRLQRRMLGRGRLDVAAKCSFSGSNMYLFGMDVVKNGITVRLFDFGLHHIYIAFIKCKGKAHPETGRGSPRGSG